MPGISYDDNGSLASYFGVTFLAVLLLPFTWSIVKPAKRDPLKPHLTSSESIASSRRLAQKQSQARRKRLIRRAVPLLLGWALFGYLCYVIVQQPVGPGNTVYDPFEILGIKSSSTEKQIKKHYKKLSLQFHPDKIKLSENQTKEDAEAKFVDLTKAYKALTDEVTRENLAKYGNPDGPQQREDKIAIPQWIVEGKNGFWVLGAYGLVLGGGIPFIVGRWWFSTRRLTRDGILNPTAELFFHQLQNDTDFINLISLLACALEFHAILGSRKKAGKKERKDRMAKLEELEKAVQGRIQELGVRGSPVMRKESTVEVGSVVARRARGLIWAHVLRMDLKDAELQDEQEMVLLACPPLVTALLNISTAYNWLATSLLVMNLQSCLTQGLPLSASPLAQLPGISIQKAEEESIVKGAEGRKWLEKWVKNEKVQEGLEEAKKLAERWPRLEVVNAEFKVAGESLVTPSSIVNLNVSLRYVYPTYAAARPVPNGTIVNGGEADPADSVAEVEDQVESVKEKVMDEKAELVKTMEKKIGRKGKRDVGEEEKKRETKEWAKNGYAHAPRWPTARKPHYHFLLGDTKLDKVIVSPVKITDIPMPLPDGTPSEPREYSLTFQAPPQANLYSFVAFLCSDTYLGADIERPIMMKVEDPPAEGASSDEEDISDPEEDTLAGQMAMMRGGKVKPSGVHGRDDEDDDESGTDDGNESSEEESSSSDEDGPRGRKKAINEDSDSDSD